MIVFPELCLTGYTCGDLFLQEILLKSALEQLFVLADYTTGHDALVFVGLPFEKDDKLYNVAAALQNGNILGLVPKMFIPDMRNLMSAVILRQVKIISNWFI